MNSDYDYVGVRLRQASVLLLGLGLRKVKFCFLNSFGDGIKEGSKRISIRVRSVRLWIRVGVVRVGTGTT